MKWSIIAGKYRDDNDDYFIGYIKSADETTKKSAENLATQVCYRRGFFFKRLESGNVLETREWTDISEVFDIDPRITL